MPALARKFIFDPCTVGIYHCWAKLVRRAFLCGVDPYSGKDYSYRKRWVRDRLRKLAGLMAIDILDYAVLGNHLHTVLRNRPDIVESWSDEEVARRWWHLCPERRNKDGSAAEPSDAEIRLLMADRRRLVELRARLSNISWFMRLLCQPIAKRANKEDVVTGRFFAERFGCARIVDVAGLLACSMYVDLNVIRAGMALTPETSEFTSAYDRIVARWQRKRRELKGEGVPEAPELDADAWLAPIFLDEHSVAGPGSQDVPAGAAASAAGASLSLGNSYPSPRASEKGFLPMSLDEYLELLDWTGRELRADKRGSIPAQLVPILERLQIRPQRWVDTIVHYCDLFHTLVGRVEAVRDAAQQMGRRWVRGIRNSAAAFT